MVQTPNQSPLHHTEIVTTRLRTTNHRGKETLHQRLNVNGKGDINQGLREPKNPTLHQRLNMNGEGDVNQGLREPRNPILHWRLNINGGDSNQGLREPRKGLRRHHHHQSRQKE